MMKIVNDGGLVNCFRDKCDWLDIGRIEDYKLATDLFENNRSMFLPNNS